MPRQARIDAPGALHHIIIRGIERRVIFKDAQDHQNFLERLGHILTEAATPCYAWALMSNHAHLLLKTGTAPIATVMRRLLTGYAQQFNRRHRRQGHLFQNRYKSFLCEQDPYLRELVRYIHLNPLRAGIVKDLKGLKTHPQTGHCVLVGRVKHEWQDTDYVLRLFGKNLAAAKRAYLNFVAQGIGRGRRPELVGGGLLRSVGGWSALKAIRSTGMRTMGDERILGSHDFVESVLRQAHETYDQQFLAMAKGVELDSLIGAVADHFQIEPQIIKSASKQRTVSRARAIVCCLAVDQLRLRAADVARKLSLTLSAVSKLLVRGRPDGLAQTMAKEIFSLK